jgi:hypothetical protein
MKKKLIISICVLFGILFLVNSFRNYMARPDPKYSKIVKDKVVANNGKTGEMIAKLYGESKNYKIGVNCVGKPIFENPNKALEQLKKDYKDAIKKIKTEFDLKPLTKHYWKAYGTYGWQVTTDDKTLGDRCSLVGGFFDIYENSFQE